MNAGADGRDGPSTPPGLLPALGRLDALLDRLLNAAEARGGVAAAAMRGLYVSPDEARSLLSRAPGEPPFLLDTKMALATPDGTLGLLAARIGLSALDADLMLIALAPELDLRYERIYGFLQDDTTRRRATVDLALNLRAGSMADKLAGLARLAPDAPLRRHGLVHLVADAAVPSAPLLAHAMVVDQQVTAWVLGRRSPFAWCRTEPVANGIDSLPLPEAIRRGLRGLCHIASRQAATLVVHLHGRPGTGRRAVAACLAAGLGRPLVVAGLARHPDPDGARLGAAIREARLRGAVLYLDGADTLAADTLADAEGAMPLLVVIAGRLPWSPGGGPKGVIDVAIPFPDAGLRQELWARAVAANGLVPDARDVAELANRFRLGAAQIADAAEDAASRRVWAEAADPDAPDATRAHLFAAARAQSGRGLAALAPKVAGTAGWDDLVLPDDQANQLREHARWRHHVLGAWGFGRTPTGTRGLNALFAGPPGTGKTMAAGVIANDLGVDLHRIDLAQVVSKYIGDTERHLDVIFRAAEDANAVLLFDEAEALFGIRSEVRDAHDRYANIEIAYLLQKMEDHDGVAILATNLRQNLDPAFSRRLHVVVEFPFPDTTHRERIWRVTFPPEAPLSGDVDFVRLAREIRLAGGSIRNIAMAAAVRAAAEGSAIAMRHLLQAAGREHQKLGRDWRASREAAE